MRSHGESIEVVEEDQSALAEYATISIAFEVREILPTALALLRAGEATALVPNAHGIASARQPVRTPWVKDYDAIDGGPLAWHAQFDLSDHWTFFAARAGGERVGSAAVVFQAPGVDMLRGRADVALLWDIRISPAYRGRGVGQALLEAVEAWAASREATWLEVETQNINVPACLFYERAGFRLRDVNPNAYPTLPNEVQLIWSKRIV